MVRRKAAGVGTRTMETVGIEVAGAMARRGGQSIPLSLNRSFGEHGDVTTTVVWM